MRPVSQAVKTSPSHGENRGSIPLQAVEKPSIYTGFVSCEIKR